MGRRPRATATASTRVRPIAVWIMLPMTWPVSTETRAMAMVRNRAMMPSVMSIDTPTEVPMAPEATVISRMPGTT